MSRSLGSWERNALGDGTALDGVLTLTQKGKGEAQPAAAWRIDRASLTFTSIPVEGLRCASE
jgi:hypothetical protein